MNNKTWSLSKLFGIACAVLLLASIAPAVAHAAPGEPVVVYDAAAHKWHGENLKTSDVMADFTDVMPGDVLVQQFSVRVDNAKAPVSVFMRRNVPSHAANAQAQEAGVLDGVQYVAEVGGNVVAQGNLVDLLEGNVAIARFSKSGSVPARITLSVPVEYGNEFQNAAYALDWLFIAQEDGASSPNGSGNSTTGGHLVQTGDDSMLPIVGLTLAGAAVISIGIILLVVRRKRNS